jgi:hypothetical protein
MLFILSQMYVVIAAAREFIVGRPAGSGFQPAGAAAWRLGDPPLAPQRSQKMNGSRTLGG